MRKIFKISLMFIFSLLIFGICQNVKANSISKISMEIYVDNEGNATISETWTCTTNSGTEVYHPYYNLGNSEIENLTVSENGRTYETLSSWTTSGNLVNKAYKCGINNITNGVELCWGISSYGSHVYEVSYTISNFIAELKDSQMLYWTLIPQDFSNSIGSVYIKIYTDFEIADSVEVWGYGNYGGMAYVYDGYIEMQSSGRLSTDEYMTILVKFPSNTFNTSNYISKNFNYYYTIAEEDSTEYNGKSTGVTITNAFMLNIINVLLNFSLLIFICIFIIILKKVLEKTTKGSELSFGKEGKKMPSDLPYYRDIPCEKDIFRAYYIGYSYGLIKNKTDLLGAIILKWIKNSAIKVGEDEKKRFFKKRNILVYLNQTNPSKPIVNPTEQKLFKILYEASKDGILESKEFEKWCRRNYSTLLKWFDDVLKEQKEILVYEGMIIAEEMKKSKNKIYTATTQLKQEAIQLAGLKKYLEEYTLIKDREAIEVTLFEDYLIYAQMLGIAKQVAKDFKEVYPEIIEQSKFTSYDNIIIINSYAAHGVSIARTAESNARNYSSGGGGFSSGGGGGGSFGGGRGRRRFPLKQKCIAIRFFEYLCLCVIYLEGFAFKCISL